MPLFGQNMNAVGRRFVRISGSTIPAPQNRQIANGQFSCSRRHEASPAAEQLSIAAVHQREGISDKAGRLAAGRGAFPFDGGKLGFPGIDQRGGNIAQSGAGKAEIQGVEEQNEPGTLQRRQLEGARQRPRRSAAKAAIEAPHHGGAQLKRGIKRKNHRRSPRGVGAVQPDRMVALCVAENDIAVGTILPIGAETTGQCRIDENVGMKSLWRWRQDQCGGRDLRQPERRLTVCSSIGIADKNATPSAGRVRPQRCLCRVCLEQSNALSGCSPRGSLDCAVETPPRNLAGRGGSTVLAFLPSAKIALAWAISASVFPWRFIKTAVSFVNKVARLGQKPVSQPEPARST
jgi:hypothetical protein